MPVSYTHLSALLRLPADRGGRQLFYGGARKYTSTSAAAMYKTVNPSKMCIRDRHETDGRTNHKNAGRSLGERVSLLFQPSLDGWPDVYKRQVCTGDAAILRTGGCIHHALPHLPPDERYLQLSLIHIWWCSSRCWSWRAACCRELKR